MFDDISKCSVCLQAKNTKTGPRKKSLSETVTQPYQGLYIDHAFSGKIQYDKKGEVIEESQIDVKGMNGETAWILVSDCYSKMLHGDCRLTKATPMKWFERFLENYAPIHVKNKFVMFDQANELYHNPEVSTLFKNINTMSTVPVLSQVFQMVR